MELRHVRGHIILDHVNIGVAGLAASRAFSERALAPLGITFVMANQAGVGFGSGGKPEFWISERGGSGLVHIAFVLDPDGNNIEAVTHIAG